ncbi:MAG: 23S rRNA (uracil(1939)-C(5))-methyltransferase RlmD [Eubacterium sp.]|nr:23S rRNA (uracil(1939)-C(5))-methyltransferase RlmD [Eubacterium sp.]
MGYNKKPEKKTTDKKYVKKDFSCSVDKKCGGCQYLTMNYQEQLKMKQASVRKLLEPFGKTGAIIGMEDSFHYRNKVHAVFDRLRDGTVISGVYQEGTHNVVPVTSCLIEDEKSDAIINDIRGLLKSFKIKTYDEDTGYGLLRHVLVRRGFASGQIMVVLVLGSPILPSKNNFVKALRKLHPEISTVVINVNDKKTSMVLGEKESVIYGKGFIEDTLCGCTFRISPKSFYQVNPVQTEKLYGKAMELAQLTGKEKVIDAYCGIGTIGMVAAKQVREVIGVELNKDAVRDAIGNAKRNDMKNIRFVQGDATEFMMAMAARGEKADVVFMDPPRSGSTEDFMNAAVKLGPSRIVYISCNPETLARDLKYITKRGYRMREAYPVDMFPHCDHCEVVCLLQKNNVECR